MSIQMGKDILLKYTAICIFPPYSYILKSGSESRSVMSDSLWPHGLHSSWNSPGQNTGVGSLFLLQGIFPTQGSNPGLLHCRRILYQLSHQGSPRILEWVAYPFSRGSSQPRNRNGVSCIAGGFFTCWAMREALYIYLKNIFSHMDRHIVTAGRGRVGQTGRLGMTNKCYHV